MTRRILLTGATGFLGGYVALELLKARDRELHCLVRAADDRGAHRRLIERIQALVGRYGAPTERSPHEWVVRLHAVAGTLDDVASLHDRLDSRIDEIWHCAAVVSFHERRREQLFRVNVEGTRALLAFARNRNVDVFNYVSTAYVAGERTGAIPEGPVDASFAPGNAYEESKREAERLVVEHSNRSGMRFRIFRPSVILGDSRDHRAESDLGVYSFANSVAALRAEVCARMPDYFRFNPLRVLGARNHRLNFIAVDQAAHMLVKIASLNDTSDRWFHIVSPRDTTLVEIGRIIGETAGVELRVVNDETELNPMDALLRVRTNIFNCYMTNTKRFDSSAWGIAGLAPETLQLESRDYRRFLEENHHSRAAELINERGRMKKALSLLERKQVPCPDGHDLTYYAGGAGERTLVLVNAFGQSLYFWNWFILASAERRGLITWQARGTDPDHGLHRPFRLLDHVDDLAAILDHEEANRVDILAWCTGPKVAIEFYRRMPERVRSMIFLGGAYRPLAGFEDLQTEYEASMEPLCHAIDAHPETAESVLAALKSIMAGREVRADQLDLQITDVLELISEELRGLVIGPFLSPSSIVRYARQLLDFWSFDVSAGLARIEVPTLFIGAEYDTIASSELSRAAAMQCPGAWWAEIAGGTHFCMFENHELLTDLVETFLEDPEHFDFPDDQVRITRSRAVGRA